MSKLVIAFTGKVKDMPKYRRVCTMSPRTACNHRCLNCEHVKIVVLDKSRAIEELLHEANHVLFAHPCTSFLWEEHKEKFGLKKEDFINNDKMIDEVSLMYGMVNYEYVGK